MSTYIYSTRKITFSSVNIFEVKNVNVSRFEKKMGIMHVRKGSSQISLCSPHRLIRDDTFRLNWIFAKKKHQFNEKFNKSVNCRPWLACADFTG